MKNNKGITMVALVITITVMIIIMSIVVKMGTDTITKTNIEDIKTNMLFVEAKGKEFVEKANHELGIKPEEATEEMKQKSNSMIEGSGKGTKVTSQNDKFLCEDLKKIGISQEDIDNGNVYKMSTEDLSQMGIKDVKSSYEDGWYIVVYDVNNMTVKVYFTKGVRIDKNVYKYCLDDIREE